MTSISPLWVVLYLVVGLILFFYTVGYKRISGWSITDLKKHILEIDFIDILFMTFVMVLWLPGLFVFFVCRFFGFARE